VCTLLLHTCIYSTLSLPPLTSSFPSRIVVVLWSWATLWSVVSSCIHAAALRAGLLLCARWVFTGLHPAASRADVTLLSGET